MAAALKSVTSLDIIITYNSINNKIGTTEGGCVHLDMPCVCTDISSEAVCKLATFLASICPNTSKLGVAGAVGEHMLRDVGSRWPQLVKFETYEGGFSVELPGGVTAAQDVEPMLPHLTHLKIANTGKGPFADNVKRVRRLLRSLCLNQVELPTGWFDDPEDWLLLPVGLTALLFNRLLSSYKSLPLHVHLAHLESVHVLTSLNAKNKRQDINVGAHVLASLLQAAPSLKLLSVVTTNQIGNSIILGSCRPSLVCDLQYVQERMVAGGFVMQGITLHCHSSNLDGSLEGATTLDCEEVLAQLRGLSMTPFTTCKLTTYSGGASLADLSAVAEMCPNLETLILKGIFHDAKLEKIGRFGCLVTLDVQQSHFKKSKLLKLIKCSPSLLSLSYAYDCAVTNRGWRGSRRSCS